MDEQHFKLWSEQLTRDTLFWNKGFRWGVFSGFCLTFLGVVAFGWYIGP